MLVSEVSTFGSTFLSNVVNYLQTEIDEHQHNISNNPNGRKDISRRAEIIPNGNRIRKIRILYCDIRIHEGDVMLVGVRILESCRHLPIIVNHNREVAGHSDYKNSQKTNTID